MLLPSNICGACADCVTVVPPVPVIAPVTGQPCPLPASFLWQGTQYTTSSFIVAVQAQVAGAVYNGALCQFTAPAGSVFPALVLQATPPPATAGVTGLSIPLVAPLAWQGTVYPSVGAFAAAVQAQVPGATYNPATGVFTAPAGSVFPSLLVSAAPVSVLLGCPNPFPLNWSGTTYTSAPAFLSAVQTTLGIQTQYNPSTCTITQTGGAVTSQFPLVGIAPSPSATLTPCPVVFPVVFQGTAYNTIAALQVGVEQYYSVTLAYNPTLCKFTQTGGSGTLGAVALTTAPTISPTGSGAVCPLVYPVTYNSVNYANLPALKAAVEAALGVTTSYTAACAFQVLAGPVNPAPTVAFTAVAVVPPAAANTGTLSSCPMVFPAYLAGVACANIVQLKQTIEALYSVVTVYDTTTCTFTKVGGAGTLPAAITVESGCLNVLSANTWNDNAGNPVFRRVTGPVPTGFTNLLNNAGGQVTIISNTPQTKCGITYSVAVANNAGTTIGYGATL